VIVRELAAKLGLEVDLAAFAKAGGAIEGARLGMDALVGAAVHAAKAIGENIKAAVEYGDKINKASQSVGIASGELQELQYAARLADVSAEGMQHSMMILTRTMAAAAKGGKEQGEAFAKLGVKVTDQNGKLRGAGDVMGDIAAKMKSLPDGAEKTALAMGVFGRSGAQMIPLLNGGAEGLASLRKEARDLGLVMDKDALEASEELNDNLERMHAVSEGLWRQAIAPLIPSLGELVKQFLAFSKGTGKIIAQNLGKILDGVVTTIVTLGKVMKVVSDHLATFGVVLGVIFGQQLGVMAINAVKALVVAMQEGALASMASGALAALPWIALAGVIAGLIAVFDDLDVSKQVDEWNKLHPGELLDPAQYSLFGRFRGDIDQWLKPQATDPWWMTAAKKLVEYLAKALGIANQLKGLAEREAADAEKGASVLEETKAGAMRGAALGAAGGAIAGTVVPGAGTAAGGVVGGLGGAISGAAAGLLGSALGKAYLAVSGEKVAIAHPMLPGGGGSAPSSSTTNNLQIHISGGDPAAVREAVGSALIEHGVVTQAHLEAAAAAAPGVQ
jgi:hypothetical protein